VSGWSHFYADHEPAAVADKDQLTAELAEIARSGQEFILFTKHENGNFYSLGAIAGSVMPWALFIGSFLHDRLQQEFAWVEAQDE